MSVTPELIDLAAAIADGASIDWDAVALGARTAAEREIITRLHALDAIASAHASLPPASTFVSALQPMVAEEPRGAWGPLEIVRRIGSGAYADVYLARDPKLDRPVALKLLRHSEQDDDSSAVIDEARLLARVRHPNVVTVYGAERIDGRTGIWMEYVDGRTLEEELRASGPLSADAVLQVGIAVADALAAVHAAGLVHRDAKAQNVLRETGGRILLSDFGTGREAADASDLAGTPLYLAPEVLDGQPASVRSDVYSLGVLLFHLATGTYPVLGRSIADLREAHVRDTARPVRSTRPNLPRALAAVIDRALTRSPSARYSNAVEMATALRVASSKGNRAIARSLAAAAFVILIGVLVGIAHPETWRRAPSSKPAASPADFSLTFRRVAMPLVGLVGHPSLDDSRLSFADLSGNVSLLDLQTGHVRQVTTNASADSSTLEYAESSVPSPDGGLIAYNWWTADGTCELRIVGADGHDPRVLLRSSAIVYAEPKEWSRDGQWILTILVGRSRTFQLALVSTQTGATRIVTRLDDRPTSVSMSPDGEFIVYDAMQSPSSDARDIFIVRPDGSDNRRLIADDADDTNPLWTPDGRHVVFASDRSGAMDLLSIRVERGRAISDASIVYRDIGRISALGLTRASSFYCQRQEGTVEVYSATLTPGGTFDEPAVASRGFRGLNISSAWSPDGRHIAYVSRRGLVPFDRRYATLVVEDLKSSRRLEFVTTLKSFLVRSWSPDSRQVLVENDDGSYAIDVQTGSVERLLAKSGPSAASSVGRGEWLRDGRILYISRSRRALLARDPQSGTDQVILNLAAEDIDLTTSLEGQGFKLSSDGRSVAYSAYKKERGQTISVIAIELLRGGPPRELVRAAAPEILTLQDWTPDGGSLLFTRSTPPRTATSLWRVSALGGVAQPVGVNALALRDVSISPDGRKITFTAGLPTFRVWVLEHLKLD